MEIPKLQAGIDSGVKSLSTNSLATPKGAVSLGAFLDRRMPDGTKWNKAFPYTLKVVTVKGGSDSPLGTGLRALTSTGGLGSGASSDSVFSVVLPISPSNISVSTPVASNLTVTLNGIDEKHNGAPLRNITISGTTGVAPFRLDKYGRSGQPQNQSVLEQLGRDLFANTIQSLNNLGNAINGRENDSLLDTSLLTPPTPAAEDSVRNLDKQINDSFGSGVYGTGYWHFHKLVKFVDKYLERKKQKQFKDEYLVFAMEKDELYYQCSLRDFSFQKRPGTLEYDYTITLTAYNYYKKEKSSGLASSLISNANKVTQALGYMNRGRKVIARAKDVFRGLEQDADNVLAVVRTAGLLIKDAMGLAQTAADFPQNVAKSAQQSIVGAFDSLDAATKALLPANIAAAITGNSVGIQQNSQNDASAKAFIKNSSSSINELFSAPDNYVDFFDALGTDVFTTSDETARLIEEEIERVRNLDVSYFKLQRDQIEASAAIAAARLGVGDDRFNTSRGITIENTPSTGMTTGKLELLQALNDVISGLNTLIVNKRDLDRAVESYVGFYTDLAAQNGISMQTPAGKFAVTVPPGATLQQIANQYLGDSARWVEIAALNQLRAPYIDEEGFEKPVKGATSGSVITLSDAEDLYVGQPVMIKNSIDQPVSARIRRIEVIDNITVLVSLTASVTGYSEEKGTVLHAYLPGTVNTTSVLYVPTDRVSQLLTGDFRIAPSIEDQRVMNIISGTDLLLTSSGDFAVTSGGDVRVATGMTNLVQAAMLKMRTPKGSLVAYPDYGLGINGGDNTADVDVGLVNQSLQEAFLGDDRFTGVLASRIQKSGPTLSITALVGLPELDLTLPINATFRP